MKVIRLTQGYYTIVDDDVYEWASKIKWCYNNGYAVRSVYLKGKHKLLYLHRLIMNASDGEEIDHRFHHTLDNRRESLRLCTRTKNQMNRVTSTKYGDSPKFSKYKGVRRGSMGKKWGASISVKSRQIHLGNFDTETEAASAYNKAALFYYGEFANLNIIDRKEVKV